MGKPLMGAILALSASALLAFAAPAGAAWNPPGPGSEAASLLEERISSWPAWTLPAPLQRPGRDDLLYPDWFRGSWQAELSDELSERQTSAGEHRSGARRMVPLRFFGDRRGAVHGDRAFNARAIGTALLGGSLRSVENDPANPNRQIAHLRSQNGTPFSLESTVIGRLTAQPAAGCFLADELALQVLRGAGAPRLSQVETLSRFERRSDGSIEVLQWQATYPPPGEALHGGATRTQLTGLRLEPEPPEPSGAA